MIEINWQEIIGLMLLIAGGSGSVAVAARWMLGARRMAMAAPVARIVDNGPPEGAVAWAADLVAAMGQAPPDSKLTQILAGSNRDQAQAARIVELEAAK